MSPILAGEIATALLRPRLSPSFVKKVIATGRNTDALQSVRSLGADVTIPLVGNETALEDQFKEQFAEGVDVVIDYLWGMSAERLLIARAKAGANAVPIRFVQVGAVSAPDITLPSAVLRSTAIELMGSGIGSVPFDRLLHCIGELLRVTTSAGFKVAAKPIPLSEAEQAWIKDESARRTVFTVDVQKC
jgi:NADPH:quinone reductase-like Zn-dependent oxidoreductase